MRTTILAFATTLLVAGCLDDGTSEPNEPNQLTSDDKADDSIPLWAGLTSVTIERYANDPCNNGANALGDSPIVYDDWARQRAGVRNICFEVWSPGITDTNNDNYWQELDVQAHFRFGTGAWRMAYVPSIDRRGNNRRYAWTIDWSLDPIAMAGSLVAVGAPLTILAESNGWARVQKDLQVYFTVNGRKLEAPSGNPFLVRYQGQARTPTLAPKDDGYVLTDIVACANGDLRIGWGAGYFGVDIRGASAIATLGAGLDGSMIYGAPVALATATQVLSTTFSSQQPIAGETLPSWQNGGGARVMPNGSSMRVEFDVYERATGQIKTLSKTFSGCASATN